MMICSADIKETFVETTIESVDIEGLPFFKMTNADKIPPFFMSIVSAGNHWMFIGSNGGLSAGRKDAEHALFPYYTVDKILETAEITGSKTLIRVHLEKEYLWEPFSNRNNDYARSRNLYKSIYGNAIIFEEINHDLGLRFQYRWDTSGRYGFVRTSLLENVGESDCPVSYVDGLQNLVPHGVSSELQNRASNLVDAYKRNELHEASGLAMITLSAMIVDKPEPREALKCNVVWSMGSNNNTYLLSTKQLAAFRKGQNLSTERDVKGEKGAYFLHNNVHLHAGTKRRWRIVANVNQTQSQVVELIDEISNKANLDERVTTSINDGTTRLIKLNASADALQKTADPLKDTRHFSNALFNVMRGGIFDDNYKIGKADFLAFLEGASRAVYATHQERLNALPNQFDRFYLEQIIEECRDENFKRIATEYLPLRFSRRHGDPSRPWNKFSINTHNPTDGSKILDYEGNWRDIFQNWEALVHAFPEFIEGMIFKFLNASTFEGYNPYRVTKDGFDWETIEADDPWSYIGYWGDHQIIYLLKFLEFIEAHKPGALQRLLNQDLFVYANVPYKIKPFSHIVKNPKDTIDFDFDEDQRIRSLIAKEGADGALLKDEKGQIHRVNFTEKILVAVLAKISNFIPEGGIWMNTQRPEWNDANNALVGNGVSMVTLYYLYRFLRFFQTLLSKASVERVNVSSELLDYYKGVRKVLLNHENLLDAPIEDEARKAILDAMGEIASDYRHHIYKQGFWGKKRSISIKGLQNFTRVCLAFIEHSITANKREDGMYHAYNLMTRTPKGVSISHLCEMLEGQAAVLSAKYLSAREALNVLDGLKNSALFREDQYSYILYPNKELPGFLAKNKIPNDGVESIELLRNMVELGDTRIVERDVSGEYHFSGSFCYVVDLEAALDDLAEETKWQDLVKQDREKVLNLFEDVFNHKVFTGRSGTFFGFEGLGSIYWHMVSKLLLATQESCLRAIEAGEDEETIGRLLEHYYEIQAGIGVHKSPALYGAFPTDPYSHTPAGRGVQQPGMTGQVKEDLLTQWGELGVYVKQGQLFFSPQLLRKSVFLEDETVFSFVDVHGNDGELKLDKHSFAFTYCQVPVVYSLATEDGITVHTRSKTIEFNSLHLDKETSALVFKRHGEVLKIEVGIQEKHLR